MQEKIRCEYCGRKNHIDNDLCLSCGATLPEYLPLGVLNIPDNVDAKQLEMSYLNMLVGHSAFSMSVETGRLVGIR